MRDSAWRVITTSLSARTRANGSAADGGAQRRHARGVIGDAVDGRRRQRVEQLGPRDLGEEAQRAEVDPEDRDVALGGGDAIGHRQQRAVAPEHQHRDRPSRHQVAIPTWRPDCAGGSRSAASRDHTALDLLLGEPGVDCRPWCRRHARARVWRRCRFSGVRGPRRLGGELRSRASGIPCCLARR